MAGDNVVRLGQLISLLSTYPGEPFASQKLAHFCGAPHRIVNADLDMLSRSFPIYSDPEETSDYDQNRFWYFEETARIVQPAFRLSLKEAMELLNCLEGERDPVICQIRSQLEQVLLPDSDKTKGGKPRPRRIFKGGKPPYDEIQPSTLIYELAQLCGRRRLIIEYRSQRGEVSKRSIDPLGLVYCWATGAWYLVAYSLPQQDYRNFRVGRILSFKEAGPSNQYENFSFQDYFAPAWGVQVTENLHKVKIRFYDDYHIFTRVRRETQDRLWAKLERKSPDTIIYTDLVAGLNEIKVWIRSFGASAEVLEPKALKEEVIKSYQRILDRYQ